MGPDATLARVCASFDVLIQLADGHGGLFPSVLDRFLHAVPDTMPAAIPGQRDGDPSYGGSNLIHDEAALRACRSGVVSMAYGLLPMWR
jgi:hypothetical protein